MPVSRVEPRVGLWGMGRRHAKMLPRRFYKWQVLQHVKPQQSSSCPYPITPTLAPRGPTRVLSLSNGEIPTPTHGLSPAEARHFIKRRRISCSSCRRFLVVLGYVIFNL